MVLFQKFIYELAVWKLEHTLIIKILHVQLITHKSLINPLCSNVTIESLWKKYSELDIQRFVNIYPNSTVIYPSIARTLKADSLSPRPFSRPCPHPAVMFSFLRVHERPNSVSQPLPTSLFTESTRPFENFLRSFTALTQEVEEQKCLKKPWACASFVNYTEPTLLCRSQIIAGTSREGGKLEGHSETALRFTHVSLESSDSSLKKFPFWQ